ncbi:type II toxin-antitoxin system HipA family toxin [Desulfonema magnum]|uniref:HipA kinase-like domain-containing protein n=1 Tax=Desulfonema magnum TaxID=45655 RepID=A0A975GKE3_9BACT|nr:type II toxin-antitoxin system HipA family toxin [Desulfonema magnum]QTA84420.1 HipA kinase-like domain-containing protein [Desulfonema magnum]
MKTLRVFLNDRPVGELRSDKKRRLVFQYHREYLGASDAHPLSLSLPLGELPFEEDIARPFFSNLLPEGDIRTIIARFVRVSGKNDMALLEKIGGECAGAVSVLPEGFVPEKKGGYIRLSRDELDSMMAADTGRPLLINREELRLSLAGAQDKLPVFIKDGEYFLPTGNMPSSHIIKPRNRYFGGTVQNEAFCMKLAKAAGLPVPGSHIWKGEKNIAYVVERYDRARDAEGNISRIHQEDFCQAMGYLPDQKYESEGGPGLAECFSLLEKFSAQPIRDRKNFISWVIFNFLIGNADAHAKNISLLFRHGKIYLAPFYDLMSTLVYPELSQKMSMKIGKENRYKWTRKRHWERFARGIGMKPRFVFSIAEDMAERLKTESADIAGAFASWYAEKELIEKIGNIIEKHTSSFEW